MEYNFIERPKETYNKLRFLDYYMDGHKGFIAGGCFKNIFKNQKIKDLDIFFCDETDFKQADSFFNKNDDYVFSYENQKVRAYKNKKTNVRLELIRYTYGTPLEIIQMFDFTITKYTYCRKETKEGFIYINLFINTFFEDLINNKLVIDDKLVFPISSFERSYRYMKYGYGLCKESKEKLITSLQNSDTSDLSNDLYFGLD